MRVDDAERWLDQQVMHVCDRTDDELLRDPLYVEYLDLFCPSKITQLVNKFLVR